MPRLMSVSPPKADIICVHSRRQLFAKAAMAFALRLMTSSAAGHFYATLCKRACGIILAERSPPIAIDFLEPFAAAIPLPTKPPTSSNSELDLSGHRRELVCKPPYEPAASLRGMILSATLPLKREIAAQTHRSGQSIIAPFGCIDSQ